MSPMPSAPDGQQIAEVRIAGRAPWICRRSLPRIEHIQRREACARERSSCTQPQHRGARRIQRGVGDDSTRIDIDTQVLALVSLMTRRRSGTGLKSTPNSVPVSAVNASPAAGASFDFMVAAPVAVLTV